MTAMKNGVYVLIAVVAGVMLVGMLPSQLSNVASPMLTNIQGASKEATGNLTLGGGSPLRQNDTTPSKIDSTTSASTGDLTEGLFTLGEISHDQYGDMMYYSLLGVGFFVAFGVYFIAKRML